MDFNHAYSVGNAGERAEPDGNVVVVVNIVNRPHDKGYYDNPFKPHGVLGINIPGEHTRRNDWDPGDRVCGYG